MALGYPHPRRLLEALTSAEITEWMAYAELEPFGERHRDTHFGILGATIANCSGAAKELLTPDKFRVRTALDAPAKPKRGKSILDIFRSLKKNGD